MKVRKYLNGMWVFLALAGLLFVFLFQRVDVAETMGLQEATSRFIVNRSLRFIVNDLLMILLIYGLFHDQKYILFAIWVQVFGLFVVLIPYFVIKVYFPAYNGPLISFLHRLVLNPLLMALLIPAFFYQKKYSNGVQSRRE
jgi:exosortase F-associated protein